MTPLQHATALARAGFSVIPLAVASKKPPAGFYWKPFARARASVETIEKYWTQNPDANIGVVCGRVSNLTVVDVDRKGASDTDMKTIMQSIIMLDPMARTAPPIVHTGSGGLHLYFAAAPVRTAIKAPAVLFCPPGALSPECPAMIDLKSENSYVVAPGSIHPDTGREYRVDQDYPMADAKALPMLPAAFLDYTRNRGTGRSQEEWEAIMAGPTAGGRHEGAVALAGLLLKYLPPDHWQTTAIPLVKLWNRALSAPKTEGEIDKILKHIIAKEEKAREV